MYYYSPGALAACRDYFTLPPSGHLYAYPGLMSSNDQASFVGSTEADATLLNASSTVEWEFAGTWGGAIAHYVPRYAQRGIVRALFAVNVPYMLPVLEFGKDEFFKVITAANETVGTAAVVLFRPNEWRGTTGGLLPGPFMLNATAFAERINAYPRGTVSHIYMTSDGGADCECSVMRSRLPHSRSPQYPLTRVQWPTTAPSSLASVSTCRSCRLGPLRISPSRAAFRGTREEGGAAHAGGVLGALKMARLQDARRSTAGTTAQRASRCPLHPQQCC